MVTDSRVIWRLIRLACFGILVFAHSRAQEATALQLPVYVSVLLQ